MYNGKSVGVFVITYNGELFIEKQLDSIRLQSVSVDVVMIYDDNSSDNTLGIISSYISKYNLINWYLHKNIVTLGWYLNALKAMKAVETDFIFWSDQDDVWHKNKVELMVSFLDRYDSCCGSYSKCDYIDESNTIMYYQPPNSKVGVMRDYGENSHKYPFLGCLSCYRKNFIKNINEKELFDVGFKSLDWILYRIGILHGGFVFVDCSLLNRRIHNCNLTTSKAKFKRRLINAMKASPNKYDVYKFQLETLKYIFNKYSNELEKNNLPKIFLNYERTWLANRIDYISNNISFCEYLKKLSYKTQWSDVIYCCISDVIIKLKNGLGYRLEP